ncbi:hypothetical protein Nepgr_031878 [Nepenthes gracilis]|uniref:Uncharacterized protein n=1 Tax=Nepenthes gracilis TaxID=150966 RepID=A0AAD3THJ7_NEPGR|nr:hypothetical protein Nepgr_031878 [Nepenthes gracilis]
MEREVRFDSVDPSITSLFTDSGWAPVLTSLVAPSLRLLAGLGHPFADYPRLPLGRPITSTTFAQSRFDVCRFPADLPEPFDEPLPDVPPPQQDEGPSGSASSFPDPSGPGPFSSHRHSTSSLTALMGQMSRLVDRFECLYSSQERILASQSQLQSHMFAGFERLDARLVLRRLRFNAGSDIMVLHLPAILSDPVIFRIPIGLF